MGRDKATLPVGGRPLGAVAAAALRGAGARRVLAIGDRPAGLSALGLEVAPDEHPGEGPLGGILTALRHGGGDVVVVLACDLPDASPRAVAAVVEALAAAPAAVAAVPVLDGRLEPLHTAWRSAALPLVEEAFAAGERAPRAVLAQADVVQVATIPAVHLHGVNTADEVAAWAAGQTGVMSDASHPEIGVEELARDHADDWILDVRQPDEYEEGHVPGAVLIPLDQLPERHGEVPVDREVFVVCRSGGRSAAAVEVLGAVGHRATNVAGGTLAWIEAGHPVVVGPEPR
jgi:molybdopterin-guanine dinucleotide biosynthesis protein A/rhodanese-related sulfurtransferase